MNLVGPKSLRPLQNLTFCYLCGKTFAANDRDRDHIPPKNIFLTEDRVHDPLILPTHPVCNKQWSVSDETIGQLFGMLHQKPLKLKRLRNSFSQMKVHGSKIPTVAMKGINLKPLVWRWVRACHAALYSEYILGPTGGFVHLQLPEGKEVNGELMGTDDLNSHAVWVEALKVNRALDKLDTIACWNGKFRFECTWIDVEKYSVRQRACAFALRLYDWKNLADSTNFPSRDCVGYYVPDQGQPRNAISGTGLYLPVKNKEHLDPFGS